MARWQETFLQLLRSGLWDRPLEDVTAFSITKEEWRLVYAESERQTVQGLCYLGLRYLPDEYYPPQSIVSQWMSATIAIKEVNEKVRTVTATVCEKLNKVGVTPVLMKGQAVAKYYEQPSLRSCGDIDLYISDNQQFEVASSLLESEQIPFRRAADGSVSFELNEVEVELHRDLIDVQRPRSKRLFSLLMEEEPFRTMRLIDDVEMKVPSPLITLLMLNAHIMKHVFTVGIGLRQFCDLARAYHILNEQYDHVKYASVIQELGLAKWSAQLHGLLTQYFGLSIEELPYKSETVDSSRLIHKVFEWGNFGQQTTSWNKAADSNWKMKLHTVKRITLGLPYSLRLATIETIYIIKNLVKGQFINSKDE